MYIIASGFIIYSVRGSNLRVKHLH